MRALFFLVFAILPLGTAASQAADCGTLHQLASVPMEIEKDSNRPVITVTINGAPRKFLLDTGGGLTFMTTRTARDLKLTASQSDFDSRDTSGNRSNMAARVREFGLGGMVAKSATIQVAELAGLGDGLDGLLSTDFLYLYDIELDFRGGRMNMFDPEHCPGRVVYWPATAVAEVPIEFTAAHIVLPVTLDGHEMHGLIDTGAVSSDLDMRAAKNMLGVDPVAQGDKPEGIINGDEKLPFYPHIFESLVFAGVQMKKPHILISPDLHDRDKDQDQSLLVFRSTHRYDSVIDPALTIGMDYLRRFHMYIAYKERKLYITAAEYKPPVTPAP